LQESHKEIENSTSKFCSNENLIFPLTLGISFLFKTKKIRMELGDTKRNREKEFGKEEEGARERVKEIEFERRMSE